MSVSASTSSRSSDDRRPIAVFDSGLGGLSVVRRLRALLPGEDIVYFGDTARVPYGTKSPRTVEQFAREDANFLLRFDPKALVVACNTASALAMNALEEELPLPVIGVVEPGVAAAVQAASGRRVAILGTEATISSNAYPRAILSLDPRVEVLSRACPLFVPLVEEGLSATDPMVRLAIENYLTPIREQAPAVVVLACTHYPLLREGLAEFFGETAEIIDTGLATAEEIQRMLTERDCLSGASDGGILRCYVSDNPARFRRIGSRFLEHEISEVEFVEPERYVTSASLEPEPG